MYTIIGLILSLVGLSLVGTHNLLSIIIALTSLVFTFIGMAQRSEK